MDANATNEPVAVPAVNRSPSPYFAPVAVGLLCWAAISLGFLGLKMLMQERPEFVGQPLGVSKAVLVQESPRWVGRSASEDVSVIKALQPEAADIRFTMQGRRDYRGLKTISDMSGQFSARYTLTNSAEEPLFVLLKCPHPRAEGEEGQTVLAGSLRLEASVAGAQGNAKDAWLWSGSVPAHEVATVEISYQVGSLKGVIYRVGAQDGATLHQVRVSFNRKDLASMHFESGNGAVPAAGETLVWERKDFLGPDFFSASILERRNVFTSLSQLAEIGPLVSLLFLLTVLAVILVRQRLTALQMLTIAAGYAFYFPLILYLSARFSFGVALTIAFLVPAALLVNYARWLLGTGLGLIGAPVCLVLFQVFPTLAVFAGWNRGMVLLCLGVVTLGVLINLQNQALRRRPAAIALPMLLLLPVNLDGADIQVVLPAELAPKTAPAKPEKTAPLLAFQPAQYQAWQEPTHLRVEAKLPFQVLQPGQLTAPLFSAPVHLQEYHLDLETSETNVAELVSMTNRLSMYAQQPGRGTLFVRYRVPIETREGRKRAQIPTLAGPSGNMKLESARNDLQVVAGSLWSLRIGEKTTTYEIGMAADEPLALEWREEAGQPQLAMAKPDGQTNQLYGIGLSRVQNLTVINSDGSCTHFVECEMPPFQKEELRLQLQPGTRLISASVNGVEISAPLIEDRACRIRLPERTPEQATHHVSFRIGYPNVRIGFMGSMELSLPELFQTVGTLEWVVALPDGFEAQVICSGLETQKSGPDLSAFGDYGRVLKGHPQIYLTKTLAPPAAISLNLRYRQLVSGFFDGR